MRTLFLSTFRLGPLSQAYYARRSAQGQPHDQAPAPALAYNQPQVTADALYSAVLRGDILDINSLPMGLKVMGDLESKKRPAEGTGRALQETAPKLRFQWCSSFMGCVQYEVLGDGPTYRVELRSEASDYERSGYNGTDEEWRRDCVAAIGLLHRRTEIDRPLRPLVVAAFNAWRAQEHEALIHTLRTQPERYGELANNDPLLQRPVTVRGAHYQVGDGWIVDP